MAGSEGKNLRQPDESGTYPLATFGTVSVAGLRVTRSVVEPGWRWTTSIRTAEGPQSCPARHVLYIESGRLGIRMDDGTEAEYGPGSVVVIPPGHDGYTAGDEPAVFVDFGEAIPR